MKDATVTQVTQTMACWRNKSRGVRDFERVDRALCSQASDWLESGLFFNLLQGGFVQQHYPSSTGQKPTGSSPTA